MTAPQTSTIKGLILSVLRDAGQDCTSGGITDTADRVTLVGILDPDNGTLTALPRTSRVFTPADDAPAVVLTWHNQGTRKFLELSGHARDFYLIPAATVQRGWDDEQHTAHPRGMFGGNFGWTSDSRLGELLHFVAGSPYPDAPLRVHDRFEH